MLLSLHPFVGHGSAATLIRRHMVHHHRYRYAARQHGFSMNKNKNKNHVDKFAMEEARSRFSVLIAAVSAGLIIGYGLAVQYKAPGCAFNPAIFHRGQVYGLGSGIQCLGCEYLSQAAEHYRGEQQNHSMRVIGCFGSRRWLR